MRLTYKQMKIYIALGCKDINDIRACKRMIKDILKG